MFVAKIKAFVEISRKKVQQILQVAYLLLTISATI